MLVGGAGQIKLTKDGNVLLHEMQIQHPTAAMIARSAVAQDDTVGDGTTTNVLFIGELLKQAERLILDGLHPRIITEGYELSKVKALQLLEAFKVKKPIDALLLQQVARTGGEGSIGDGKIFVLPMEQAVQVSDGTRGPGAI